MIILGKATSVEVVTTNNNKEAMKFTLMVSNWDPEANTNKIEEVLVWLFKSDKYAYSFENARKKNYINKNVIVSASPFGENGNMVASSAPKMYGICENPAQLREVTDEATLMAVDEKIAKCVAAGELPEGYSIDANNIESILDAKKLLVPLKTDTAKEAIKALFDLHFSEEYVYIGNVASVKKNDKGAGVISFALPVAPGSDTKWASCLFYGKTGDNVVKVLEAKKPCVLYMTNRREMPDGRILFSGIRFVRL